MDDTNDMMDGSSLEDHGIRTLSHTKSGSLCQIHDVGATVLCFHPNPDKYSEVLFMSRDAILNGSQPIRGGIPICFPIFGPPEDAQSSDMPQHGFARRSMWRLDRKASTDTDESATMTFHLKCIGKEDRLEGRGTKGFWAPSESAPSCLLTYKLTLKESSLTCALTIDNTGEIAFPVQALFHTYYEAHGNTALDPTKCYVEGLQGYQMVDKVNDANSVDSFAADKAIIEGETDRVFHPPVDQPTVDVRIQLNRPSQTGIRCTAKASVDAKPVPVSCVVWNPHEEKAKAMKDFGDDQYHEMICVEPGILGKPMLEPGKQAVLEMTIEVQM